MDDWILEGLQIQIDKEEVFKMIDCYEDSPVYEEVAEEYDEILEDMRALLKPIGIIGLGEITENIATEKYPAGTRTIFAVLSVGNEIKEESTKYFHEGDYVRGMLIDAIADTALFSLDDETEFEVLTGTLSEEDYGEEGNAGKITAVRENGYEVAVDIGTTTIAMELIGKDSHKVLGKAAFINSQRAYGADVISRIQASTEGRKEELQKCIRDDLEKGLKQLVKENELALTEIKNIVISGNTTMIHLLMGYDCSSLGVYPFTPVNIGLIRGNAEEILGMKEMDAEVQILPGISAYVGGDIVSGLFACDFDRKEEVCMLIDLGTNGEMAIGNKDRILVTSTAAGPAFEGGNITWGTGSIPGAICTVHIEENKAEVGTIKNAPPVGICGTGVVETAAELLKEELIDETGRLEDEYFDEGYPLAETKDNRMILFTQKDMREIQLAKAAIRAGAETLACRYGINKTEISKVYVAGGFGYKLDTDKAIAIGMFPEEFEGHIEAVGNSSLGGAGKYLCEADVEERVSSLVKVSEEIALSTDKVFNDFYMDAMFFE